jgi:hypothetical protein
MHRAPFALRHFAPDSLKDAEQLLLDISVPSQGDLERMYAFARQADQNLSQVILEKVKGKDKGAIGGDCAFPH